MVKCSKIVDFATTSTSLAVNIAYQKKGFKMSQSTEFIVYL